MEDYKRFFGDMFQPASPSVFQKHGEQLCLHRGPRHLQMLARSAVGLVDVYILLPEHVVEQKSAAAMQHELQMLLKFGAPNGDDSWLRTFSPRVPLSEHPMRLFLETSTCVVPCCRPPITACRVRVTRRKRDVAPASRQQGLPI